MLRTSAYLKWVVVMAVDNKYAGTELCTCDVLAQSICRRAARDQPVEAQVVSIAGVPPSEAD